MNGERELWFRSVLKRDLFRLPKQAEGSFKGKSILITGGAGSIGSELLRRLRELDPATIVVFDNAEDRLYRLHCELQRTGGDGVEIVLGDINSASGLEWVLEKHSPQMVFHAAAYKHVDFLEAQPLAAVRTNVFGTRNVLRASLASGVESVVVLSSDKATNPISVLGATKRAAEHLVRASDEPANVSAVRLCNVLETAGSLVPLVLEQAKAGVVRITHDAAERYFIAPSEAADLLLSAASCGEGGILVPAHTSRLNIRDLASRIVDDMGPGCANVKMDLVGLRPGERLTEGLCAASELIQPSAARGLQKATATKPDLDDINDRLGELEDALLTGDENLVIQSLMDVVPEYKPSYKLSVPVSQ
jgi:FlaA1/EpsC-like NDP-sugar epimerase